MPTGRPIFCTVQGGYELYCYNCYTVMHTDRFYIKVYGAGFQISHTRHWLAATSWLRKCMKMNHKAEITTCGEHHTWKALILYA